MAKRIRASIRPNIIPVSVKYDKNYMNAALFQLESFDYFPWSSQDAEPVVRISYKENLQIVKEEEVKGRTKIKEAFPLEAVNNLSLPYNFGKVTLEDALKSERSDPPGLVRKFEHRSLKTDNLDGRGSLPVTFSMVFLIAYSGTIAEDGKSLDKHSLKPRVPIEGSRMYQYFEESDPKNPIDFLFKKLGIQLYYYKGVTYIEKYANQQYTRVEQNIDVDRSTLSNISFTYDEETEQRTEFRMEDFSEKKTRKITLKYAYVVGDYPIPGEIVFFLTQAKKERLVVEGDFDSNVYVRTGNNLFKKPVGLSFHWIYNDGTKKALEASELASMKFFLGQTPMTPDQSRIKSDKLEETIRVTVGNFETTYKVKFQQDGIAALEVVQGATFYLGSTPSSLQGTRFLKATFANLDENGNPRVDEDFKDYEVLLPEIPVMSPDDLAEVPIKVIGHSVNADVITTFATDGKVSFIKPDLIQSYCKASYFPTKYVNGISRLDLKGNKAELTLVYGTGIGGGLYSVLYTETVPYDDKRVSLSVLEDLPGGQTQTLDIAVDGSEKARVALDSGKAMISECRFRFVAKGVFDASQTATVEVPFSVVEMSEIKGIAIDPNSFRFTGGTKSYAYGYQVGQKFLEPDVNGVKLADETSAIIYFTSASDSSGKIQTYTVRLDSGFEAIRINPARGTLLSSVGNRTVRVSSVFDSSVYTEYSITAGVADYGDGTQSDVIKAIFWVDDLPDLKDMDGNPVSPPPKSNGGVFLLLSEKDVEREGEHNVAKVSWNKRAYGYIKDFFDTKTNAKIVLFQDYIPPAEGHSNISITYPVWVKGNASLIDRCTFGHLFGNNNARNRLFVSGNPDRENRDWHTGATDTNESGDFSFFPDTSWQDYGQSDNRVIGYDTVSTDKMAVLKTRSFKEPSVYYRTSTLLTALDSTGSAVKGVDGSTLSTEAYPLSVGNIGPGAYNPHGVANVNGDTLFISGDHSVVGLDIEGQIGDSLRAANTRSFFIDPDLRERDLSDATLWSDGGKLWMVLEDSVYATDYRTLSSETRQYEWFKTDLSGVSCMGNIGGKMVFGTKDGKLCFLEGPDWSDCEVIKPMEGDMVVYPSTEMVTVSNKLIDQLKDHQGYAVSLSYGSEVFRAICKASASGETPMRIGFSGTGLSMNMDHPDHAKVAKLLGVGSDIFIKDIVQKGTALKENHAYRISLDEEEVGDGTGIEVPRYRIFDGTATPLSFEGVDSFSILARLEGEVEFQTEKDDEGNIVPKVYEGNNLRLIDSNRDFIDVENRFGYERIPLLDPVLLRNPVKAFYVTAPNALGGLGYSKTIWSLSMTTEPSKLNDLKVGIATNRKQLDSVVSLANVSQGEGFDFGKLDFGTLYLGKSVIPGKMTTFRAIYPLPFVCLGFGSDKNLPSRLTPFEFTYSTSGPSFGQGGNL